MPNIVGTVSYASGEQQIFTDPKEFIKTVKEELEYRSTSGFTYQVMNADAATRKAVDDLVYDLYGEDNPHGLAHYESTESEHLEKAAEALNTALYEKMFAEQETYRDWLLQQPPEEILKHTYEYTVREDILLSLESNDLSAQQASVLLQSSSPLGDVFQEFEKLETGHMDTVLECLTDRANTLIQWEQEEKQALLKLPVYPYPASYAKEHGELDQYRASHKANIACRDAIDTAIADHYRNNSLGSGAVKQVVDQYGYDRTLYVLANTVRQKDWDGRISRDNKAWAKTIPVYEDQDSWGGDRRCEFVVDRAHTGLMDLFTTQARREYLLTQPLTKEDIQQEAARLLGRLQEPSQPNSSSGTHFMAQISQDFLLRASSKDRDRLFSMLPFQSLTFSGIKDRKGIFAMISKEENRNQPLRKPSVRKKLQKTNDEPKPPTSKKCGLER